MRDRKEMGVITLEACVVVVLFLVLTLFLSSLFYMFMAQNVTAHAVLQTSESLSLDVYATNKLTVSGSSKKKIQGTVGEFIVGLFGNSEDNPYFVTDDRWFESKNGEEISQIVKTRFIGYLTGADEEKAEHFLAALNVKDGLDGLDFSESYIENGTFYIVLKYELQYNLNIWHMKDVEVRQTTSSKLWMTANETKGK